MILIFTSSLKAQVYDCVAVKGDIDFSVHIGKYSAEVANENDYFDRSMELEFKDSFVKTRRKKIWGSHTYSVVFVLDLTYLGEAHRAVLFFNDSNFEANFLLTRMRDGGEVIKIDLQCRSKL